MEELISLADEPTSFQSLKKKSLSCSRQKEAEIQILTMIRDAVRGDEVAIMGLIRELAIYEKAEEMVINTAEDLGKHLFDEKVCSAIVAVDDETNKIVGFALYYECYSTWRGTSQSGMCAHANPPMTTHCMYIDLFRQVPLS